MRLQDEIREKLRAWSRKMVSKYDWLTIRFEYNERRRVYLVVYSPMHEISDNIPFINDSSSFEDAMVEEYGDDAPLFSFEGNCFSVSSSAEEYSNNPNTISISVQISYSTTSNRIWEYKDVPPRSEIYYKAA